MDSINNALTDNRTSEEMRRQIVTRMIVNKVNREAAGKDKPKMDTNTQRQLVRRLSLINDKIKDIGFKLDTLDNNNIDSKEKIKLEKSMAKNLKEKAEVIQRLGFGS